MTFYVFYKKITNERTITIRTPPNLFLEPLPVSLSATLYMPRLSKSDVPIPTTSLMPSIYALMALNRATTSD